MKLENSVKIFKEIHPKSILLFKFGSFYRAYGRDSLIVAFIFGYQINEIQNTKNCGFPKRKIGDGVELTFGDTLALKFEFISSNKKLTILHRI